MAMKYHEVGATTFVRQFPKMTEAVRAFGIISVRSHNRSVGAFISPSVLAELEELRRRRRTLEKVESMDDSFFHELDEAVATYDKPATVTETR